MRIVILASGTVDSNFSARVVSLGKEMVKRNHDVYLIAPSLDKYSNFQKELFKSIAGVKVIRPFQFSTHNNVINFLPYIPHAFLLMWRLKADVIHLYKPTPLTVFGIIGGLRSRTKVVLDLDDLGAKVMAREGGNKILVKIVDWCESISAKLSDGIIVASSYLQQIHQKNTPNKPLLWIPNGALKVEPYTPGSVAHIIFIGSLNNRAVLAPLLEVVPKVKKLTDHPVIIDVIGGGTAIESLKLMTADLGIKSSVFFHGWIKGDILDKYVHGEDLGYYCVPDEEPYKAASSQKIFDYMSHGIVPVVNEVGDLPYYIDYGKAGYIVDANLSQTLANALSDKEGRRKRSHNAINNVNQLYLWKRHAELVESFYISLHKTLPENRKAQR